MLNTNSQLHEVATVGEHMHGCFALHYVVIGEFLTNQRKCSS